MILWTTVFFYFSVEEVLISGSFPSVGVQKSSMLGFFCFTEGELLVFALHPLMERIKNQIEISIYCREQSNFFFDTCLLHSKHRTVCFCNRVTCTKPDSSVVKSLPERCGAHGI